MSEPRVSDTAALLRLLTAENVEFIVVGMAAAVLQGVPTTTQDLDIVHRRTPENVDRLLALLLRLGAYHRSDLANRRLPPTADALLGRGHLNLQTIHGPIDVLCELGEGVGYDELRLRTETVEDGSVSLLVLDLPTLIAEKARAARPKDKLALPLLLATLQHRRRRDVDR
jgi:hypothetical protein